MADYLLDTNIILRAVQPQAPTHSLAVEAVATILEKGENLFIAPQILIEFWAVTTRPVDVNGLGWPCALAETEIQQLRRQFPLLEDRPAVFWHWLQLVKQYTVQGKNVHDARLVAIMQAYGITHLLTFNGDDFQRYAGITVIQPRQLVS